MKIAYRAVNGSVFELVKTAELDIRFNESAWFSSTFFELQLV
jgi:hypothetical protein